MSRLLLKFSKLNVYLNMYTRILIINRIDMLNSFCLSAYIYIPSYEQNRCNKNIDYHYFSVPILLLC